MNKEGKKGENLLTASLFIIIPTIMLIVGYFIYPNQYPSDYVISFTYVLIVLSLALLGAGAVANEDFFGKKLKILGWMVFAFYWATQPANLYLSEDGDIFNTAVCIIGVFVLSYIAYHEWLSDKRKEEISCLNWIAGAAVLAGIIYFGVEKTPVEFWLRQVVASQSGQFLGFVTGEPVIVGGPDNLNIFYKAANIFLIFACTGVQSMVIFVGVLVPLPKVDIKRKLIGLAVTIIPIYILNIMRNAMVAFLVGNEITDFHMAHNVIAKLGALLALIVLLLIIVKIIPEVMDEIFCLADLRKRSVPIEKLFRGKK